MESGTAQQEDQHPLAVQTTNDDSIVSKRSAARFGYIKDEFLRAFDDGSLKDRDMYYEIDFPEVVARKTRAVQADAGMAKLIGTDSQSDEVRAAKLAEITMKIETLKQFAAHSKPSSVAKREIALLQAETGKIQDEIHTNKYHLMAGDLRKLDALKKRLEEVGVDFNKPTLLFAECVLTYMLAADSSDLIKWAQQTFSCSIFMAYEQINPSDNFGGVMCGTLKKRNSPLLGVGDFPTAEAQAQRYRSLGFTHSYALTTLSCYEDVLSNEERFRVELLEEYDEFEEWVVKCSHYTTVMGSQDGVYGGAFFDSIYSDFPKNPTPLVNPPATDASKVIPFIDTKFEGRTSAVKRSGHASAVWGNQVVVFGGFGGDAKQQRLNDILVLDTATNTWRLPSTSGPAPDKRMFHSATLISGDRLAVYGGRAAPGQPFDNFYVLDLNTMTWRKPEVKGSLPAGRFRHTASKMVDASGKEKIVIFGGKVVGTRKNEIKPVNDLLVLDVESSEWEAVSIASEQGPSPRFSHSATVVNNGSKLIVFGGSNNFKYFGAEDMWSLESTAAGKWTWTKLATSGDAPRPRFSHTASPIDGDNIIVVGGCSPLVANDVYELDLGSLEWKRLAHTIPEKLNAKVAFTKHTAEVVGGRLVLVGGGILCFSFGTILNEAIILNVSGHELPAQVRTIPTSQASTPTRAAKLAKTPLVKGVRGQVKVVENVTEDMWTNEIYPSRVPVLMKACNLGPCVESWKNPAYWTQHGGDKKVSVRISTDKLLDFVNKNYRFETVKLSEFIAKVFDPSLVEKFYFRSIGENMRKDVSDIKQSFPELASDFVVPELFRKIITDDKMFSSALRISSNDIAMWTHYDVMDNILCQVVGSKRVVLWEPSEIRHLYVKESTSEVLNIDEPNLDQFPRFAKANSIECILEPGDVLYIPSLWFHNVVTLAPSISVNLFYRHLAAQQYDPKDLYGNKDLMSAQKAIATADTLLDQLQAVPEAYREFYARMLIEKLKSTISH